MKHTLATWCARGTLALLSLGLATASAHASTIYNFTFTSIATHGVIAAGSFTTGAPNMSVPGYEIIDSITINAIIDSSNRTWGHFISTGMPATPSYNPTTQTFTNFDMTGTQPGLGDVSFQSTPVAGVQALILDTTSFDISKHYFSALLTDRSGPFPFPPSTPVVFQPGTALLTITSTAPVPEPTTLVLLGSGLVGMVIRSGRLASRSRSGSGRS